VRDSAKQHIFFVDDEPDIRKVVGKTLGHLGLRVSCFASADDCLKHLRAGKCDLLITDVKMPKMDGIELLIEAKRIAPWLPVVVITGYGDVPMAVRSLKAGAADFIEKPLDRETLIRTVESVLRGTVPPKSLLGKKLSRAEIMVLRLLLDGKRNAEIAIILSRSVRTIEDHRRHIMRKLGVDNLVDLVKHAAVMELIEY
jgi:FixJ family two-component response regulator